jgi:hypothetical protein
MNVHRTLDTLGKCTMCASDRYNVIKVLHDTLYGTTVYLYCIKVGFLSSSLYPEKMFCCVLRMTTEVLYKYTSHINN